MILSYQIYKLGVSLAVLGSVLLPVSGLALGPPRPYAAHAAGPGGIPL